MSFTYGFYNSIERDRLYDAIQVSKIFDGIILDGVYETVGDAFIVQASDEPNLVVVGPGRAWFNHTWNENDGYLEVELDPPETVLKRIDMLVIDVDERVSIRKNDILVVKGTPSTTPTKPTLVREPEHNQYPIAYILRNEAEEIVSQAGIENAVGTTDCPFVTGVLEGLDVDLMLLQWRATWTEFLQACQDHIDEWEESAKEDVAMFIDAFKLQCNEFLSETESWQTIQKESFRKFYQEFKTESIIYEKEWKDWVSHLVDILDEDALGHLLLEMEKMKEDVEKQIENTRSYLDELISGFQAKKTQFLSNGDILTTYPDGSTITTVFLSNGDIEETLRASNGTVGITKITEFLLNGDIEERVVGGNYPEFSLSKGTGVGAYINREYGLDNEAFENLQSIRDVANSEEMMEAIVENKSAWDGLSKSPTAMNAFLASDVALSVFAEHDDILQTLVKQNLDVVIGNSTLLIAVTNSRQVLKSLFENETNREEAIHDPRFILAIMNSTLQDTYPFAKTGPVAFALRSSEGSIAEFTWAIFFDKIYTSTEDVSGMMSVEFWPTGDDGEKYYWRHDVSDEIRIQPIVVKISKAYAISSVSSGQVGVDESAIGIAF